MRLTRQQALDAFQSDDLIGIGMEADAVRRHLHPENVVTYVIECPLCCTTDTLGETLDAKLAEAIDRNATGLTLHGSLATLGGWEHLLTTIHTRHPALWLHGVTATQVVALSYQSSLSAGDTLARLQVAGLQSLAGTDAGILDEEVHSAEPRCTVSEWLATHRTAHQLGLPSTAAMLFGAGETPDHRIHHLEAIHHLQEETGGFTAFLPRAVQPAAAGIPGFEEATAVEYLRTLAISRIVLDNLASIEADWATQGTKVLQMALRFGANDLGSTMPGTLANPDALLTPDGTTEEDLRRIIRGAGFQPVQRDTPYRTCLLS